MVMKARSTKICTSITHEQCVKYTRIFGTVDTVKEGKLLEGTKCYNIVIEKPIKAIAIKICHNI